MAERLSTGFVDAVNQTGSVKSVMANSVIHIYSGSQPATADDAETGDLLMIITESGGAFTPSSPTNGLNMDVSTGGVLAKDTSESWEGVGLEAAGEGTTAGYFRWYANDVTTGASTTAVRVDGNIGTLTTNEMRMSSTTIIEGVPTVVNTFTFQWPKQ
jgi:hypothetical protein